MDRWATLRATVEAQLVKSRENGKLAKNADQARDTDHWNSHAAALLYVLTLMRQIEEPKKRHTTGNQLPLIEIEAD